MIAVTSAMIVPSLDISGASVEDESERLRSTLRFAMEESQLSGEPLRWVATKYGWYFENLVKPRSLRDSQLQNFTPVGEQQYEWIGYENEPLGTYNLPEPLLIEEVKQAVEFEVGVKVKSTETGKEAVEVLGMVMFLPDGTTSQSDIVLGSDTEGVKSVTLRVRPGPAGIRFKREDEN